MARVASGESDAAVSPTPKNEWDIAAGVILCHEAGAAAMDAHGAPLRFNTRTAKTPGLICLRAGAGSLDPGEAGGYRAARPRALPESAPGGAARHARPPSDSDTKQLLHLVFGGELKALGGAPEFRDLSAKMEFVGAYPDYASAVDRLEGQGAGHRGQRADALLHRPRHRIIDPSAPGA